MKLAFALLAHGRAADVARLVQALTGQGHPVALHYDVKSPAADFEHLRTLFAGNDRVSLARRVPVGWGEWSVVEATLDCLDRIADAGWEPDYVYYVSGMDYPIRSSDHLTSLLDRNAGEVFI